MLTILGHQNEEAHGLSKACDRNQLCVCVISAMDDGNCSTGGGGPLVVSEQKFINRIRDTNTVHNKVKNYG